MIGLEKELSESDSNLISIQWLLVKLLSDSTTKHFDSSVDLVLSGKNIPNKPVSLLTITLLLQWYLQRC